MRIKRIFPVMLAVCIFICSITIPVKAAPDYGQKRYTVLVLDISSQERFLENGLEIYVAGTALEYVKNASLRFMDNISVASGENYIALVSFQDSASILSDFSEDYGALKQEISGLQEGIDKRSISDGLQKAQDLLDQIQDPDAIKNIVLFTTGMTNSGNYFYEGGHFDENSQGSRWYRIDNNVSLYAYANSAYLRSEEIREKGINLYTIGLFQTMEGMPASGLDVVELFKKTARDLASSEEYYYEVVDPNILEFTFGEVADEIISTKVYDEFYFASGDYHDYTSKFYYDDTYFSQDASKYNESLATMSLCLALSAFGSNRTDDYKEKSQNARDLLEKIGFEDIDTNEYFKEKPGEDSMGVIVGHKEIMVGGQKYTLVALATRGGGYEAEWAGNFTIGESGRHQGFNAAAQEVERYLGEYFNTYGSNMDGEIKIWMAGYSRAAATANLVAADITGQGGIGGRNISKENIYAYCFETPQGENTTNVSRQTAQTYTNIHNIVNPNDVVTKVAMGAWGFIRYGVDEKVIPSRLTSSNSEDYEAMMEKFKSFNTESTQKSLVKDKNGKETHILNTFQAKKIDFDMDVDFDMNVRINKKETWFGYELYYITVDPKLEVDVDIIQDDNKSMELFLNDLLLDISVGLKHRSIYTSTLQNSVRVVTAIFTGKGSEADKWASLPERYFNKLQQHALELAWNLVYAGGTNIGTMTSQYFIECMQEAGIDIEGYADLPENLKIVLGDLGLALATSVVTSGGDDLVTLIYNGGMLFTAHFPELCLAWLQSQDPNYTENGHRLFIIDCYRVVHINCPVDVCVYDSNGNLVAQIIDDKPMEVEGSTILSNYTTDGEKLVYLPADQDYRVEIVATGDGTLNYSVDEFSYEYDSYAKIVNYKEIPITKGEVLSGDVPEFTQEDIENTAKGSGVDYSLKSGSTSYSPDEVIFGDQAMEQTYAVSVVVDDEEAGIVKGGGAYTRGSFAQVSALPLENCEFEGWYIGGSKVSDDLSYRFCVDEDTEITAQFSGERPVLSEEVYKMEANSENVSPATEEVSDKDDLEKADSISDTEEKNGKKALSFEQILCYSLVIGLAVLMVIIGIAFMISAIKDKKQKKK